MFVIIFIFLVLRVWFCFLGIIFDVFMVMLGLGDMILVVFFFLVFLLVELVLVFGGLGLGVVLIILYMG